MIYNSHSTITIAPLVIAAFVISLTLLFPGHKRMESISDNRSRINITSASLASSGQQKVEPLQPVTSYTLPTANLVAQLLLESSPELVAQIPLDHLAQKDIVEVFRNIPKDKIVTIIKEIPQERFAEY